MEYWIFSSVLLIYGFTFLVNTLIFIKESNQERSNRLTRRYRGPFRTIPPPEGIGLRNSVIAERTYNLWMIASQPSESKVVNWKRDGF
jgi:hypothetical protein